MRRTLVTLLVGVAIGTAAVATPALGSHHATCSKLCQVERQNAALRRQVTKLRAQVRTLKSERDTVRSLLAQAQSGVAGGLSTMGPDQIWPLFGNPIAAAFNTAQWSKSYYSSGSDYESWTFTRCGFCS
jgi:hypothetical protein